MFLLSSSTQRPAIIDAFIALISVPFVLFIVSVTLGGEGQTNGILLVCRATAVGCSAERLWPLSAIPVGERPGGDQLAGRAAQPQDTQVPGGREHPVPSPGRRHLAHQEVSRT